MDDDEYLIVGENHRGNDSVGNQDGKSGENDNSSSD